MQKLHGDAFDTKSYKLNIYVILVAYVKLFFLTLFALHRKHDINECEKNSDLFHFNEIYEVEISSKEIVYH